jgi:hypothetical protein
MIGCSKEDWARIQEEKNSYKRSFMTENTKVVPEEKESPVSQAHRLGFPQPTETFEEICKREGPAAIQFAIDSAKK